MEKINHANIKWKTKKRWSGLVADQEDFKAKNITRDKEDHFPMIKRTTFRRAKKLIKLKEEIDKPIIIV